MQTRLIPKAEGVASVNRCRWLVSLSGISSIVLKEPSCTIGTGPLTSSPVIHRHPANPLLSAQDVPYEALLVFNAGVTKYQGRYVMVFRNDYGRRPDSVHPRCHQHGAGVQRRRRQWEVQPKPCFEMRGGEIRRGYDPRLTVMDGRCYMCFAVERGTACAAGSRSPMISSGSTSSA